MKIKFLLLTFFLAFYFGISSVAFSDSPGGKNEGEDKGAFQEFLQLSLKGKEVSGYNGFYFNFQFMTHTPDVIINYVHSSEKAKQKSAQSCNLFTNLKVVSATVQDAFNNKIMSFPENLKNMTAFEKEDSGRDDLGIRFDFIVKSNVVMSYWLDPKSGFCIQQVDFDQNGQVLTFSGYRKVDFRSSSEKFSSICGSIKRKDFALDTREKMNAVNSQLESIMKFCEALNYDELN